MHRRAALLIGSGLLVSAVGCGGSVGRSEGLLGLPVVSGASASPSDSSAGGSVESWIAEASRGGEVAGREAHELNRRMLLEGIRRLADVPEYTCTFYRHERVDGELLDPQLEELKFREEPFSVALLTPETGRHVVYVDGENDGRMLVRASGDSIFLRRLRLEPLSPRVMSQCRYPVTEIGLKRLAQRIAAYRERDLTLKEGVTGHMRPGETPDGRPCYSFVIEYTDPALEPVYRKCLIDLDRERLLPVYVRNYTWSEDGSVPAADDETTLLETYIYSDLDFEPLLSDEDFTL